MADIDDMKKPKKKPAVCGYPLSIFFIVVSEFCERFSYYGMRAVLVLYFKYFLRWDDDLATSVYHIFVASFYLTPILGAIVADSWLGKFKTIIYASIFFAVGQAILAISAIHDLTDGDKDGTPDTMELHVALAMVGLLLVALGTGGIKPCVGAFGGDQFEEHQERQRAYYFSMLYMSINTGSLLSTVITPILRVQECGIHTKQSCYPLAFGVPSALMVVALLVFIFGSGMYTKHDPKGNIMLDVCKCIWFAIKNRYRHRSSVYPVREHWMDWADEKYDKLLIAQVKMVLKVLFLYIPLPMVWALFDQQGSRWTLQATTMDGDFGIVIIQPDQMQTIGNILLLVLVPAVDIIIYPLIGKCKINFTPLKKLTVGMLMTAIAFIAAALVQIQIDQNLPKFPTGNAGQIKYINMVNEPITVIAGTNNLKMEPFKSSGEYLTFDKPFDVTLGTNAPYKMELEAGTRQTNIITKEGTTLSSMTFFDITAKPEQGANAIRFVSGYSTAVNITVGMLDFGRITSYNMSDYVLLKQGEAKFEIRNAAGDVCVYTQKLGFGSSYTLVIPSTFTFGANCEQSISAVLDINPNTVHMAWQIPQILVMTVGEVMYCITGLEFSYSQAPSNMKSVLQAGWLFTIAVGNIFVLIVAEAAPLPDQWSEYILFASLMVVVSIIFAIMAYFYTYVDPTEIEAKLSQLEDKGEKRKSLEMKKKVSHPDEKKTGSVSNSKEEEEGVKQTKI